MAPRKVFITTVIVFVATIVVTWAVTRGQKQLLQTQSPLPPPTEVVPTSTIPTIFSSTETTSTPGFKAFRNRGFGFGFPPPRGWNFHAGTFYSPFSKFNLVGAPS